MSHVVTAPAIQVRIGARQFFLETGATVPDGIDEDTLDRLVDEGMIAEVDDPVADADADAEAAAKAKADADAEAAAKAKADADAKTKTAAAKAAAQK